MTSPAADATAEDVHVPVASSIDGAAKVASSIDGSGRDGFELSNGVVLRFKSVPPIAMREAAIQVPLPPVPTVFMEDKGREEENPNDPDYLKALEQYALTQLYRVADVLLLLGTEIVYIPEGVEPPESDDWVDALHAVGIQLPDISNKQARRLAWMRFYAVRSEVEIAYLMGRIVTLSGVTEVEVQRAAAAFLDRP